ncbi:MAG: elongation factor G [Phycisphaerales bacterium]
MPEYTTSDIRNVVLAGTHAAGKTTLIEQILHNAGLIGRVGKVEDGNTVSDFDDLEKSVGYSLDSSLIHIDHDGAHINIIDTPGMGDFIGKTIATFPAVETVMVMIDADRGIDPVVRRVMERAAERNLPRLIIINKIEHGADLAEVLSAVQETFGSVCQPINLPADGGTAVVDCFRNAAGDSDLGDVAGFHTAIVDQVVEIDEDLMAQYLEQGSVTPEQLEAPFKRALRESHLVPVCFTSAKNNVGVTELMHTIAHLLPSPLEGNARTFITGTGEARREVNPVPDSDKSLIAHVFKVSSDPYVGKLCFFRVHQGHIGNDVQPVVDDGRKGLRIAHVFKVRGKDHADVKTIIAGDIGAVAKIDDIHFNSTMHTGEVAEDIRLKELELPKPMYGLAIEGKSKGAETKLGEAMSKLTAEDPTFKMERVAATHETVIRGLGELHLRMKLRLLKERYGVEVESKPPRVAYKETITSKAEGHHRHKKQTGGAGQFGEVYLRVAPITEPGEEGEVESFEFVDDTFGGSIPRQFLPAIEKGIRQILGTGAIAGYPMQGIRVEVYDGKYHAVDSKEVAFITAGKKAFVDAVQKAKPVLLEPFVHLEITVPADLIGDISSDLSGRRGRIQGTDMLPGNQVIVKAEAPLSEVMTYSAQLKSMSGGAGSYTMEYSHDEPAPPNVQADVVAQFKPRDEED